MLVPAVAEVVVELDSPAAVSERHAIGERLPPTQVDVLRVQPARLARQVELVATGRTVVEENRIPVAHRHELARTGAELHLRRPASRVRSDSSARCSSPEHPASTKQRTALPLPMALPGRDATRAPAPQLSPVRLRLRRAGVLDHLL